MKRLNLFGIPILTLGLALLVPGLTFAHDGEDDQPDVENRHDVLHERLEAQHDTVHENLREKHAALHERLSASDLEPNQQRRIHNAVHDNLQDRHENADRRLRRIHAGAHDRANDQSDTRPGRRVGPPNRVPPQRRISDRPGRRVGPLLNPGRSVGPNRNPGRQARNR